MIDPFWSLRVTAFLWVAEAFESLTVAALGSFTITDDHQQAMQLIGKISYLIDETLLNVIHRTESRPGCKLSLTVWKNT